MGQANCEINWSSQALFSDMHVVKQGLALLAVRILCAGCGILGELAAQSEPFELPATDTVYDDRVQTILFFQLHPEREAIPVMTLGSSTGLELFFDLLQASPEELYYSIYHFDQDWNPSSLHPNDYYPGFPERQVENYQSSRGTEVLFMHYRLHLGATDVSVSGNFLICIFDRWRRVLFTRRFYVTEQGFSVELDFVQPVNPDLRRSHQALTASVTTGKLDVANNGEELSVMILQNGDPNTAIQKRVANFFHGNTFRFNKSDEWVFPARKEFRYKDLRTIRSRTPDIELWEERDGEYHAWLIPDGIREGRPFYTETDINGRFLIHNLDRFDPHSQSDYVRAHFTLKTGYPLDQDVYLYGAFSSWKLLPAFRMEYDPGKKAYLGNVLLKLGYYNYLFASEGPDGNLETEALEGNWYEAENDYVVLVYYRPFGGRYDRLMFSGLFNSNR